MPKKAFGEGSGRFPCKSWVSKFGRKSVSAAGWPPGGLPKAGWLERPGLASSSQGLLLHRTASPSALLSPPEAAFFCLFEDPSRGREDVAAPAGASNSQGPRFQRTAPSPLSLTFSAGGGVFFWDFKTPLVEERWRTFVGASSSQGLMLRRTAPLPPHTFSVGGRENFETLGPLSRRRDGGG